MTSNCLCSNFYGSSESQGFWNGKESLLSPSSPDVSKYQFKSAPDVLLQHQQSLLVSIWRINNAVVRRLPPRPRQ